jgi:predicted DCC family thiol-disulfide oxidoreductase YuxK
MEFAPIIFYDGLCGFCNALVRLLARLDRNASLRFAPIQSALGASVLARHPELRFIETAFVLDNDENGNERVTWKARMLSRVSEYLAWPEKILLLPFNIIPRTIGDRMYDLVARNRYRFFRRYETCPIPPAKLRSRFIGL